MVSKDVIPHCQCHSLVRKGDLLQNGNSGNEGIRVHAKRFPSADQWQLHGSGTVDCTSPSAGAVVK